MVRTCEGVDPKDQRMKFRDYVGHVRSWDGQTLEMTRDAAANGSRPEQRVSIPADTIVTVKPVPERSMTRPRHSASHCGTHLCHSLTVTVESHDMLSPTRDSRSICCHPVSGIASSTVSQRSSKSGSLARALYSRNGCPCMKKRAISLSSPASGRALLRGHAVQHVGHKRQPIGHITQQRFDIGGVLFHHCTGTVWIG